MTTPRRRILGSCLVLLALGLAIGLGLYAGLTGPRADVQYPDKATSPYRLPWAAGESRFCIQGNRAVVSHRDDEEFAWDFVMPVDTPVLAMRGGRVSRVVDDHDGNGTDKPNNLVTVDHGDGTFGHYLHIRRGGALVKVGQVVRRGEPVARSGNVGRSMLPHVHVQVTREGPTIPISFGDVDGDGIPRMLHTYTSGNR
jgi:murein DD-endopeptidase MepM/ murein hydrolase activator NlpD